MYIIRALTLLVCQLPELLPAWTTVSFTLSRALKFLKICCLLAKSVLHFNVLLHISIIKSNYKKLDFTEIHKGQLGNFLGLLFSPNRPSCMSLGRLTLESLFSPLGIVHTGKYAQDLLCTDSLASS